jgi:CRP/FNR family cyclic AMP-dependent transcriptional regulator
MRAVLEYCVGGNRRSVPEGTLVIREGETTGHLFVLIEGRLEVVKADTVFAVVTEPGSFIGEMSVLLDRPHTATVRRVRCNDL